MGLEGDSFQPVLAEERTACVSLPRNRADLDPNLLLPLISSVTLGVSRHLFELFFFLCKTENNISTHRVAVRNE